jgi:DNA-binding NarL/FixJ family response regulator
MGLPGGDTAAARKGAPKKSRRSRRPERGTTRIFIISAHAVYREALRLLLERERGFRVVGGAADCVAAARPVHGSKPDILLLDLPSAALPDRHTLRKLVTICARTRLVVLAPDLGRLAITEALLLGVRGVVLKSAPVDIFFSSLRAIVSGQYCVGREDLGDLVQTLDAVTAETPEAGRAVFGLTARELEILSVLVPGCADEEIARHCGISERTVKHHLKSILHKLGLTSRLELTVFALQHQLVVRARELPDALQNGAQLEGLLPICAGCRKVRDGSGYWSDVEEYFESRAPVEFTHAICPDCEHKLYPSVVKR